MPCLLSSPPPTGGRREASPVEGVRAVPFVAGVRAASESGSEQEAALIRIGRAERFLREGKIVPPGTAPSSHEDINAALREALR